MKEIITTMLGASGVGKTTLLTSMYEQLEEISQEVNLKLEADTETEGLLNENLEKLKSLADELKAEERKKGISGTSAPAGPESLPKFTFNINEAGSKTKLRLLFRDYPGGYVSPTDPVGRDFVKKLLRESAAVIIAIDTPAMVEPTVIKGEKWQIKGSSGMWHEARNKPNDILKIFEDAYYNLNEPKLVILAPVKCETYVQSEESANQLLGCIKEKYAPLLEFLENRSRAENIAVVTAPVQTVGCMFFSRITIESDNTRFWFRKRNTDAIYAPKDNDHLLRYFFSFLFKVHNDKKLVERSEILFFIRQLVKHNTVFHKAVKEFAKNRKTTGGFAILQGEHLLNI